MCHPAQGRRALQVAQTIGTSFLVAAHQSPDADPNSRLMFIGRAPWPTGPQHQALKCWWAVESGGVGTQLVPRTGSVIEQSMWGITD